VAGGISGRLLKLFLAIAISPYRRGDVLARWTLLAGTLIVLVLIPLRVPFLGINLGAHGHRGTALTALVQLGMVGLCLALGARRLRGSSCATQIFSSFE
jgi:hypothetical protein